MFCDCSIRHRKISVSTFQWLFHDISRNFLYALSRKISWTIFGNYLPKVGNLLLLIMTHRRDYISSFNWNLISENFDKYSKNGIVGKARGRRRLKMPKGNRINACFELICCHQYGATIRKYRMEWLVGHVYLGRGRGWF